MSFFFSKYLTSASTSIVDNIIFSGGIVEVQNPFSDSEMTGEHGKDVPKVPGLLSDVYQLLCFKNLLCYEKIKEESDGSEIQNNP